MGCGSARACPADIGPPPCPSPRSTSSSIKSDPPRDGRGRQDAADNFSPEGSSHSRPSQASREAESEGELMDKWRFRFGGKPSGTATPSSLGKRKDQKREMGAVKSAGNDGVPRSGSGRAGSNTRLAVARSGGLQRGTPLNSTGTWSPNCTPLSAYSMGDTPDGRAAAFVYPSHDQGPRGVNLPGSEQWRDFASTPQSTAFYSPITPIVDDDDVFLDGQKSRELGQYERLVPRERNARSLASSPRIKLLQWRCGFLALESDELSSLTHTVVEDGGAARKTPASHHCIQSSA